MASNRPPRYRPVSADAGKGMSLAFEFAGAVFLFWGLGKLLENWLGIEPWGQVVGGIVVGLPRQHALDRVAVDGDVVAVVVHRSDDRQLDLALAADADRAANALESACEAVAARRGSRHTLAARPCNFAAE